MVVCGLRRSPRPELARAGNIGSRLLAVYSRRGTGCRLERRLCFPSLDSFDVTLGECHIGGLLHVFPSLPVRRVESLSTYQHEPSDWEMDLEQQSSMNLLDGNDPSVTVVLYGQTFMSESYSLQFVRDLEYYQILQVLRNIDAV